MRGIVTFTESVVEDAALSWLGELNYAVLHGLEIAPGELAAERSSFGETVLEQAELLCADWAAK